MEQGLEAARAAAEWAGHDVPARALGHWERYAEWLAEEAIPAGGLGPREGDRLWSRHIADALVFAVAWTSPPRDLLDVGSGVGLPGIPLAALWPETAVTLLDRAGRRTRLLERAVRVLGLDNVTVVRSDVSAVKKGRHGLVARGSVRLATWPDVVAATLGRSGCAVFGLSRRPVPPPGTSAAVHRARELSLHPEVVDVAPEVLDGPAWLLIMSRCSDGYVESQ